MSRLAAAPRIFWVWMQVSVVLFLLSCTQSGDGPLHPASGQNPTTGLGFYRGGALAAGRLVHPASDTLFIQLDSLWTYDECSLRELQIDSLVWQSQMALAALVRLQSSGRVDCAVSTGAADTLLAVAPQDFWRDLRGIRLEGVVAGTGNVDDDGQVRYESRTLDTVLVRRGTLGDTAYSFALDSLVQNARNFPLVYEDGAGRLVYYPDTLRILDFFLRLRPQRCVGYTAECDLRADTLAGKPSATGDTILAPIRPACLAQDSINPPANYCPSGQWVSDSSQAETFIPRQDSLWSGRAYLVERIDSCAVVNLLTYGVSSTALTVQRELFVPAVDESECWASTRGPRLAWELGKALQVEDPVLLDSLFARAGL